jgi:hypothetical protein
MIGARSRPGCDGSHNERSLDTGAGGKEVDRRLATRRAPVQTDGGSIFFLPA